MTTTLQPARPAAHTRDPLFSSSSSKPTTTTTDAKEIWSTLLTLVASTKTVPSRHLLVLGGNPTHQHDLIESLAPTLHLPSTTTTTTTTRRTAAAAAASAAQQQQQQPHRRRPPAPLANTYVPGYTVRDIPTGDGEDVLCRLGVHTFPGPARGAGSADGGGGGGGVAAYAPVLRRLLAGSAEDLAGSGVAVCLDYARPWDMVHELLGWVRLLRRVVEEGGSRGGELARVVGENDERWKRRRDEDARTSITDGSFKATPLAEGEFDIPLGLPLTVVVLGTEAMEALEREGWREGEFDFVLQTLRTVALRHGAGIVYAAPGMEAEVRGVVFRGLELGEGQGEGIKHNVVERERVVVPPGWDSWGKIRVLREGYDIEGVSRAWGVDVERDDEADELEEQTSVEALYRARIANPKPVEEVKPVIEVEHVPDQAFFAAQLERLEAFRAEDEAAKKQKAQTRKPNVSEDSGDRPSMNEQIGQVQFNVGGIQYDADEALRRIKARARPDQGTPDRPLRTRESTPFTPASPPSFESGKDIPVENLEAYFASLMKGGRGGSAQNSPRVGTSPRVTQRGTPGDGNGAGP